MIALQPNPVEEMNQEIASLRAQILTEEGSLSPSPWRLQLLRNLLENARHWRLGLLAAMVSRRLGVRV